jgi:hypothetical protein
MRKIGRVVVYAVYFTGLLLLVLLPANRYEWMREMNPDIPAGAIESTSGNNILFAFLLLIIMLMTQIILLIKTEKKLDRVVSVILISLALLLWGIKFW